MIQNGHFKIYTDDDLDGIVCIQRGRNEKITMTSTENGYISTSSDVEIIEIKEENIEDLAYVEVSM